MSLTHETILAQRATQLRRRLRRFKLVFVQCGVGFDVIRDELIVRVAGTSMTATQFAASATGDREIFGPLVLTDLEAFASRGEVGGVTMGMLRKRVDEQLDKDTDVCLVSRVPRVAYWVVAGSSLLEDAAPHCIELLSPHEFRGSDHEQAGAVLPAIALQTRQDLPELFRASLRELGLAVLAALD